MPLGGLGRPSGALIEFNLDHLYRRRQSNPQLSCAVSGTDLVPHSTSSASIEFESFFVSR